MNKKEQRLIIAAGKGDRRSYEKLFKIYYPRVHVLALSKLRNQAEAEEVAQQTMIKVWQKLGTLQNPEAFGGWISRVTINSCNEHLRKKNRPLLSEDDAIFESIAETDREVLPEPAAEQRDLQERVGVAVNKLSDEQREVVVLYYYNQLSVKEITDATGVTGNTIKSRLRLARKYLQQSLTTEGAPAEARAFGVGGLATAALGSALTQHFVSLEPSSETVTAAYEQVASRLDGQASALPETSELTNLDSLSEKAAPSLSDLAQELRLSASVEIPLAPANQHWPNFSPSADNDKLSLAEYLQPIKEYRERLESCEQHLIGAADAILSKL